MKLSFLDLFAGAGGLSEGFIQAGFSPVAHVEMNRAACNTLRTRTVYHELKNTEEGRLLYRDYLEGKITRAELYAKVPTNLLDCVIEQAIGHDTINDIFKRIDALLGADKIDVIVGGPPCQAYSVVGRSRVGEEIKDDERNYLFNFYVDFLEKYKPRYFVFENVTGLHSAKDKKGESFYAQVLGALNSAGYQVFEHLLKTERYGIPQKRRRVILIGCRDSQSSDDDIALPEIGECPLTINEIYGDLKPMQAGEGQIRGDGRRSTYKSQSWMESNFISDKFYPVTYHQARPTNEHDKDIYRRAVAMWDKEKQRFNYATDQPKDKQTHKNTKSFLDRFKVVDGNSKSSHTIVAHITKDGHYYIHPDIHQNRSITPREAARLQTFPDNYFFESATVKDGRGSAYKQIGNAVPVMLARLIAFALKKKFGKKC